MARPFLLFMNDKRQKKSKGVLLYLSLVIFFCVIILFYVYEHIQALRYGYVLNERRAEEVRLRMDNDQLLMQIKEYTALPRLEELAKTKLGLHGARQEDIVVLDLAALPEPRKKKSMWRYFSP